MTDKRMDMRAKVSLELRESFTFWKKHSDAALEKNQALPINKRLRLPNHHWTPKGWMPSTRQGRQLKLPINERLALYAKFHKMWQDELANKKE